MYINQGYYARDESERVEKNKWYEVCYANCTISEMYYVGTPNDIVGFYCSRSYVGAKVHLIAHYKQLLKIAQHDLMYAKNKLALTEYL